MSHTPLGFAADIRQLFREKDRDAMHGSFDLWSYDDVVANAEPIAQRLENGTMPCDGPWTDAQVGLFRQWLSEGAKA
jgi:hypothetical protein